MSIDANELARLRAVAEAATPGPWTHNVHTGKGDWTCKGVRVIHQILPDNLALAGAETDGVFIAAFDPPTVLALLDEVERLHSWAGLIELLDEHWPESIIPTLPDDKGRDLGPRLVSLIRMNDQLHARLAAVEAVAADYMTGPISGTVTDWVPLDELLTALAEGGA